jgi:hypothetical protein
MAPCALFPGANPASAGSLPHLLSLLSKGAKSAKGYPGRIIMYI